MKLSLVCALVVIALASVEGGPRPKIIKSSCNKPCPRMYDPVCAQDVSVMGGAPVTFTNICGMEKYNCEHASHMQVIYKGQCRRAR